MIIEKLRPEADNHEHYPDVTESQFNRHGLLFLSVAKRGYECKIALHKGRNVLRPEFWRSSQDDLIIFSVQAG